MRDYYVETTFDVKFTTRRFSTGAPHTLAGSPAVAAYPDNSTTEITAGITLSVDFDGRTGLNNIRVVATGANGYAAGSNYSLVITAGTVDGVSVVGEVVGEFSLEAQSPLRAATPGRELAIEADGMAHADLKEWLGVAPNALVSQRVDASVGAMAANTLTASALAADAVTEIQSGLATGADVAGVQADTNDIQTRLPAALVGGRMDSSIGAVAAGAITAASFAAGAFDAVWTVAVRVLTAGTNIVLAKGVGVTGFNDLSAAQVNAEVVDALATDTYAEPGQETPATTSSLATKISYLMKAWRNKHTNDGTTYKLFNDDAVTVDQKATVADDGVTFTRGEVATGP